MKWCIQMPIYLLTMTLVLVGCGSDSGEETVPGDTMTVQFDKPDNTLTIQTPDGDITFKTDDESGSVELTSSGGTMSAVYGDKAKIPDNFPKDVPLYPKFEPQSALTMGDTGSFALSGTVPATPDEILAYYKKEASAQGWTETVSASMAPTFMINYSKDGRILMITGTTEDGTTTMSINVIDQQ